MIQNAYKFRSTPMRRRRMLSAGPKDQSAMAGGFDRRPSAVYVQCTIPKTFACLSCCA